MLWISIFVILLILTVNEYTPIKSLQIFRKSNNTNTLFWIICIILVLLAGLRGEFGYDKNNYIEVYNNTNSLNEVFHSYMEPGYVFIGFIFHTLKMPIEIFFLFIASLSIFIKALFAIYFIPNKKFLFLFYYFTLYYFTLDNAQIRYGVAIAFVLISIKFASEKKLFHFIFAVLFGALFHIVSIAFLPIYVILNYIKLSRKKLLLIIFCSILFYLVDFISVLTLINDLLLHNDSLRVKLIEYSQERQGLMNVSFLLRIGFLVVFYYFYKNKMFGGKNQIFFMIYLYGFVLYMVFNTIPILAIRASSVPRILEVSLVDVDKNTIQIGKQKISKSHILLLVILTYCTFKFIGYMMEPAYFIYTLSIM